MNWLKGMLGLERDGQAAPAEAKAIIGMSGFEEWSRQDSTNFRTNQVTLADFNDSGAATDANALALSAVWACCQIICGTSGSLGMKVTRKTGPDSEADASDHPLYNVLEESPNAEQTSLDYWEFVSLSLELKGNAFSEIKWNGDRSRVLALAPPFSPDAVTVRRNRAGALEYEVSQDGSRRTVQQNNMFHIRGFGGNPMGGLSTLAFARRTFGLAGSIESAARSTFKNGIRQSGVFSMEQKLAAEQRRMAEELILQKYSGAHNAGVPMLLDNGVKFNPISINPEDAQMLQSRAFSVEEICRFFSVPPHMIGHTEKNTSWGSGIEQQNIGFLQYTMRRRLKRIEKAIAKQLFTPADRAQGLKAKFNLEGLLRGDSASRGAFHESALKNKWRTINEVRALEGLPPVEWGDRPWGQMQDIQLDEAGNIPAAQGVPNNVAP